MEEPEKREGAKSEKLTRTPRVYEEHGLVQMAVLRGKVSTHTCNNLAIVLALSSSSNSTGVSLSRGTLSSRKKTSINVNLSRGIHSSWKKTSLDHKLNYENIGAVNCGYGNRDAVGVVSPFVVNSQITNEDRNVGTDNHDVFRVSPYFSKNHGSNLNVNSQMTNEDTNGVGSDNHDVVCVSPYFVKNHGRNMNAKSQMTSKGKIAVGFDNRDAVGVVSPYFSKNHGSNLNVNSQMTNEDTNGVGSDNHDVICVSPYFVKNHGRNMNAKSQMTSKGKIAVGFDNRDAVGVVSPYFVNSQMTNEDINVVGPANHDVVRVSPYFSKNRGSNLNVNSQMTNEDTNGVGSDNHDVICVSPYFVKNHGRNMNAKSQMTSKGKIAVGFDNRDAVGVVSPYFVNSQMTNEDINVVGPANHDVVRVSPYFSKNRGSNLNVNSQMTNEDTIGVGSDNHDVVHLSPYFVKNLGRNLNANSQMTSKAKIAVGYDNRDAVGVVSPYIVKSHRCNLIHSQMTIENKNVVGSDNGDVAVVVSPYFGKEDFHKRNVLLKSKRRRRGRDIVRGCGQVGSGDCNVRLRGMDEKKNEESCCWMAVVEEKREENVALRDDMLVDGKSDEVLSVKSDRGIEEEEQRVGATSLSRGVSVVECEEKTEDSTGLESEGDILRKNQVENGMRAKKKMKNADAWAVELSVLEKKGKDGTGYGNVQMELDIKDVHFSVRTSAVKREEKILDLSDIMLGNAVLELEKRKPRREYIGTGDVLGVSLHQVEKKGKFGVSDKVEQHLAEGNISRVEFVFKPEDTHEKAVKVKDVGIMRINAVLKSKINKRNRDNITAMGVQLTKVEKRKKDNCCGAEKGGEEHVGEGDTSTGVSVAKHTEKCVDFVKLERGREIHSSDVTCNDYSITVSPYFMKMDGEITGDEKVREKKKIIEIVQACNELEREAPSAKSSIVSSSYFLTEAANDHEKSKSDSMENGAGQKVYKLKRIKEINTFLGGQDTQTKKELKEERKVNKRKVDDECFMEGKNPNKNSGLESQDPVLSDLCIEVINEVGPKESIESAASYPQQAFCEGDLAAAIKLKGKSSMEHNGKSPSEPQEATSLCSENVGRKRVKGRKLDRSKEDQILPVNEKREDERDEPYCKIRSEKRIDKVAPEAVDIFSKYAYKGGTVNGKDGANNEVSGKGMKKKRRGDANMTLTPSKKFADAYRRKDLYKGGTVNCKDGANDEVSGKGEKKRTGNAKVTFTRVEKFADAYKKKDPNNIWKPPSSPYNLLQEDHAHDPWKVLVICLLLNVTTGDQVKPVLPLFLHRWPNAKAAIDANRIEIAKVIASLGLKNKRSTTIQRFSREYLEDGWTHVTQLHGIGKYAADAHAIFCNGTWENITPNDRMLNKYWEFLRLGRR